MVLPGSAPWASQDEQLTAAPPPEEWPAIAAAPCFKRSQTPRTLIAGVSRSVVSVRPAGTGHAVDPAARDEHVFSPKVSHGGFASC
ncbi:MAG: hypothetical protein AAFX76_12875 [Planctomycetota bacterium]